jgi:hypothetical protein
MFASWQYVEKNLLSQRSAAVPSPEDQKEQAAPRRS